MSDVWPTDGEIDQQIRDMAHRAFPPAPAREEVAKAMAAERWTVSPRDCSGSGEWWFIDETGTVQNMQDVVLATHFATLQALCRMQHEALFALMADEWRVTVDWGPRAERDVIWSECERIHNLMPTEGDADG